MFRVVFPKIKDNIKSLIDTDNTEMIIKNTINLFYEINTKEVDNAIKNYYDKNYGTVKPIQKHYDTIAIITQKSTSEINQFIRIDEKQIVNFKPLLYNCSDYYGARLISKIKEKSTALNINYNDLINYKTPFTTCDHGIISATLFFENIVFSKKILNNSIIPIFNYFSQYNSFLFEENLDSYSKVIFSILLHNVYTRNSKDFGIEYKHNIEIDAFSYFCAFMDVLQKWDRPKQADQSKIEIPTDNFLDENYDVFFTKHHIVISCFSSNAGEMRKQIND